MKKLAIIGAGDLGEQIAHHAKTDGHYTPVGFFDDFQTKGSVKYGLPILGTVSQIEEAFEKKIFDVLMVGIGYKHFQLRASLFDRFNANIPFGSIIHTSSYVDSTCILGDGIFIYPGCVLDMNVKVGNNVLINVGCTIAHDTTIGAHSFLSPAVKIAGFVNVKEQVSLGIGTVIIDNVNIQPNIRTSGGAVVIEHLNKPGLYVGVPAIFKK